MSMAARLRRLFADWPVQSMRQGDFLDLFDGPAGVEPTPLAPPAGHLHLVTDDPACGPRDVYGAAEVPLTDTELLCVRELINEHFPHVAAVCADERMAAALKNRR